MTDSKAGQQPGQNPIQQSEKPVVIYTTQLCGFCHAAKRLLSSKAVDFEEIAADGNHELRRELAERTGQDTVPQIWIGQKHVGGFTDLLELERQGLLDTMLAKS